MRFASLLCLAVVACAPAAQFTVEPSGLPPESTATIFGVFRNGRMDPEGWQRLEAHVAPAFGREHCPVYYQRALAEENPEAFSSIDSVSREEGAGTELLVRHPKVISNGDAVVMVQIWGHLPIPRDIKPNIAAQAQPQQPSGMVGNGAGRRSGGRRGGGGGGSSPRPDPSAGADDNRGLDIDVALYARTDAHKMGGVHLHYTGDNMDEALDQLEQQLRTSFNGITCVASSKGASK